MIDDEELDDENAPSQALDLFNSKLVQRKEDLDDDVINVQSVDVVQDIINLLLDGKSRHEIALAIPYDDLTARTLIQKAEAEIASFSVFDVDAIIADHVSKYERLYEFAIEKGYSDGRLRAMKQKENILAVSNEVNEVRIINETQEIVENREDYDFVNKLTSEERKRLLELIDKMNKS